MGMRNNIPTALSQVVEQFFNAAFSIWLAYIFFDSANPRIELAVAGGTAGTGVGALAGCLVMAGLYALVSPVISKRARNDRARDNFESRSDLIKIILRTVFPIIVGMSVFTIADLIDHNMIMGRLAAGGFPHENALELSGQYTGKYVLLTTLPVSISMAMATAIIPNMAESHALRDAGAIKRRTNLALRISMMITIPAAVGLAVLSDPILKLLFPSYSGGGTLLRVGAAGIVILALVQIITGVLQGVGRVNAPVIGAFIGVLVKIPLNYVLIADAKINIIGAVISTCVFYFAALLIDTYFLHRYTGIMPNFLNACLKPLASAAVMGLACFMIYQLCFQISGNNAISCVLAIGGGVAAYLYFMLLVKGFKREELTRLPGGKKLARVLGM
jgi:stage V sporulation protein B